MANTEKPTKTLFQQILDRILTLPWLLWKLLFRSSVKLSIFIAIVIVLLALPVFAGTRSYPVAVVEGNSMIPTYHNGDLVFYSAPKAPIKTGTVIVFIQSDSGITVFDTILKPIIIHRVISVTSGPNGAQTYQTKGDNNQASDPFNTDQGNVLGTPVYSVPYLGFPILFFKTAYGMLMVVALVSLYFFSGVDTRIAQEQTKKRFMAIFAKRSLTGEFSPDEFERLNIAIEYEDEIPSEEITDPLTSTVVKWVKNGGLENDWTEEEKVQCPTCNNTNSFRVAGRIGDIQICPSCKAIITEVHTESFDLEIERPRKIGQSSEQKPRTDQQEEETIPTPDIRQQEPSTPVVEPVNEPEYASAPPSEDNMRVDRSFEEASEQLKDQISNILEHSLFGWEENKDASSTTARKRKTKKTPYESEDDYYSSYNQSEVLDNNSLDQSDDQS